MLLLGRRLRFVVFLGVILLPTYGWAQCDPSQGRVFLFSAPTGLSSLSVKTLHAASAKSPLLVGAGTMKLLDGSMAPLKVTVRAKSTPPNTIVYTVGGKAAAVHAHGHLVIQGCPATVSRVNLAVSEGKTKLHVRALADVSLAGVLALQTVLLDATDIGGLLPDQTDATHLVFQSSDPVVASLAPGSVIVAGITSATPQGLLRRVDAVMPEGVTTVLVTEPATLVDAFDRLDIEVGNPSLTASTQVGHPVLTSCIPVVSVSNQHTFYDTHGIALTVVGDVSLTGACLSFGVHFDKCVPTPLGSLCFPIPTGLSLHSEVRGTLDLDVKATAESAITVNPPPAELPPVPLPPIEVAGVVVNPTVTAIFGISAQLDAGITAEASDSVILLAGISCNMTIVPPVPGCGPEIQVPPTTPQGHVMLTAGGKAKAYVEPRINLDLYDNPLRIILRRAAVCQIGC